MTLNELDAWANAFLKKEEYGADPSRNGIQITNSAPDEKEIRKVAFAVDAVQATAEAAVKAKADVLFVHHGLFWGGCETLTGVHYKRVAPLIKADIALIANHIPLDANWEVGNNAVLADRLCLTDARRFGEWNGMQIGMAGTLPRAMGVHTLAKKVLGTGEKPLHVLPFGVESIRTVGIISGGAGGEMHFAVEEGLDAYITGEMGHGEYHYALESRINVIAGGHYQTETVGVNAVRKRLEDECGIETVFLDFPTGM